MGSVNSTTTNNEKFAMKSSLYILTRIKNEYTNQNDTSRQRWCYARKSYAAVDGPIGRTDADRTCTRIWTLDLNVAKRYLHLKIVILFIGFLWFRPNFTVKTLSSFVCLELSPVLFRMRPLVSNQLITPIESLGTIHPITHERSVSRVFPATFLCFPCFHLFRTSNAPADDSSSCTSSRTRARCTSGCVVTLCHHVFCKMLQLLANSVQ